MSTSACGLCSTILNSVDLGLAWCLFGGTFKFVVA